MTTSRPAPRRGRPGYDIDSLLAKSVEVFTRKGFDGTSMEDLSRRLGITKSAIYHHVASKNELLELAVGRALDGLDDAVATTRALPAPAIDRLEHLIRRSVSVLVAQKPFVTLLLRIRGNTEVERRALERRKAFDRFVAELVAEAKTDGSVRPEIDPDVTARLLFGMVNSLTEWVRPAYGSDPASRSSRPGSDPASRSSRGRSGDVEMLADAICALAFTGIRPPDVGPAAPSGH